MKTEFDKTLDRLKRKGGTMHMSLRGGVVAHVKGERPVVLVEPVKDRDCKKHGTGPLTGDN